MGKIVDEDGKLFLPDPIQEMKANILRHHADALLEFAKPTKFGEWLKDGRATRIAEEVTGKTFSEPKTIKFRRWIPCAEGG